MTTNLQAEIKQRTPFPSREEEAYLSLMRTSAVLEHSGASWFKARGLTLTQYNVLRILRGAGAEGLCRNEVSERMIRPVSDATRLLDRMVGAGWVERVREEEDRRYVTARITEAGLDLVSKLDSEVEEFHREQLGHMSRDELTQLIELLNRARHTGRASG